MSPRASVSILRVYLGATDKDERARAPGRVVHRARDGFLARPGRTCQKKRLGRCGLTCDGIAQCPDDGAVAEQGPFDAIACFVQERLRDAQFAFERRGSLRNPSLERRVGLLQRGSSESSLFVQPRIVDRTRNLVGDDRHEVALMLAKRARHGTFDREHADQVVADEQRNGDLALRVGESGHRDRLSELCLSAGFFHLAPLCRSVRALLPQVVDVHHSALLRDDADHAGADLYAPADCLILVAPACHDFQRLPSGSSRRMFAWWNSNSSSIVRNATSQISSRSSVELMSAETRCRIWTSAVFRASSATVGSNPDSTLPARSLQLA